MFVATHIKPSSVGWNTILKRTWQEAHADDLLGRSAQLSYYFFLALLPFLICTLTTLAIFYGSSDQIQRGLLSLISSALPGSAANLVEKALTQIDQAHASSKISVGILFWLWSASNGMSAIMDALNAEYEVKETRSFLRRTAIAIVLTAVAAILLFGAVLVIAEVPGLEDAPLSPLSILLRILHWCLAAGLILLEFAIIYFFAPDVKNQKWHWITPGAVVGLFLCLAVSCGFKLYLHFYDTYDVTYGSLGAVIILLLWFYCTGAALLFGAEFNSVIEELAAREGAPDAKARGERFPRERERREHERSLH